MSAEHSLTRRSALAGLGIGSLGLMFGASATAAPPAAEAGGSGGSILSTATHQLAGRWLSSLGLPSRPDVAVAVPTFFGAEGPSS